MLLLIHFTILIVFLKPSVFLVAAKLKHVSFVYTFYLTHSHLKISWRNRYDIISFYYFTIKSNFIFIQLYNHIAHICYVFALAKHEITIILIQPEKMICHRENGKKNYVLYTCTRTRMVVELMFFMDQN